MVSPVLEWVPVLAILVLVVEVMAAGVLVIAGLVTRALLLLKFEPVDQEACLRLVRSHPSKGQLASAGVVVSYCLVGNRYIKGRKQYCIP